MNNKEIEQRICDLEKILNAAEGRSYTMVSITLGFQMRKPPQDFYVQWLKECGVIANDLLIFCNRVGSQIPFVGFRDDEEPPPDWLILENVPSGMEPEGQRPKIWVHPLLIQRFKAWLKEGD